MSMSVRSGLVGLAVGVVLAGGVAVAAIPSTANNTYSACMSSNRTVKMLDEQAGERCPRGTKLLQWNKQGQPGPAGQDATRTAYVAQRVEDMRVIDPGGRLTVTEFNAPDSKYVFDVAVTVRPLERTATGRLACTFGWAPQLGGYNSIRNSVDVEGVTTLYMSALGVAAAVEGPQGFYCNAEGTALQIVEWRVVAQPIDSVKPLTELPFHGQF